MERPHAARHCQPCDRCESRLAGVFSLLGPAAIDRLNRSKVSHAYARGQILFYEGNPCTGLFCVRSGVVKLTKNALRDRMYILRLAGAGDVLGLEALLTGERHTATAQMLQEGTVCQLDRGELSHLMETHPVVYREISAFMAEQLRRSEEARAELASAGVRERLARTLLGLAERYGDEAGGRVRIGIDLSREDLAEMVGATTETAIRYLGELRDRRILSTDGRTIIVDDRDRLSRLARAEHGPEQD